MPPRRPKSRPLSIAAALLTLGWSNTPRGRLGLRRAAGFAVRLALRARSRPFSPSKASTVLVVAPHPDDESLGCGGAIALLAQGGAAVHIVFVTDGGGSHPSHPRVTPADLAALRCAEARAALEALGIEAANATFLRAQDGGLSSLGEAGARELAGEIAAVLERVAPDTLLVALRHDGSTEHDASFALVLRALGGARPGPRVLEYPVWSWWNPSLLMEPLATCRRVWRVDTRPVQEAKARALRAYASQTDPIPPDVSAALPEGFTAQFLCGEEYLFER